MCNGLLIVILTDKDMRNSFNFMLIALSFCDAWYLFGSILESFRKSFNLMSKTHMYLFPHFLFPGQMIAMTASIYLIVAISFERYAAVHYPLNYHQVRKHSLIRGVLIQSCSAGAKNFTNYVFCHPQFSGVIQNIENCCAILTPVCLCRLLSK